MQEHKIINALQLDLPAFYEAVGMIKHLSYSNQNKVDAFKQSLFNNKNEALEIRNGAANINLNIINDAKISTRTNPLSPLKQQEQDAADFMPTLQGTSLLMCIYSSYNVFYQCFNSLYSLLHRLRPPDIYVSNQKFELTPDLDKMQMMKMEYDINSGKLQSYLFSLYDLLTVKEQVFGELENVARSLENYYLYLSKKYSIEGNPIYNNAVATDVAVTIIKNIDAHGEIDHTKDPAKISAYSANRALAICRYVKNSMLVQEAIKKPASFTDYIIDKFNIINSCINELNLIFSDQIEGIKSFLERVDASLLDKNNSVSIEGLIFKIKECDPSSIVSGRKTKVQSKEERKADEFFSETVKTVTEKLLDSRSTALDIKDYILERKTIQVKQTQINNSFYTCRIGSGDPFLGVAPGALEVVPASKPNVKIENIKGSGFKEAKEFIETIKNFAEFRDLFLATSPTQATDKANCLLIGPPGCGKTELMRAIASEKNFSAIVASGSDFLTAWKGEDQKNPKRLFEQALRIHQDTGTHVHVCIDEIDSVLNSSRNSGETNLSLEFQTLMDGLIDYPGISVWGATNNPQRIPMPMIRRFPKVLIVGELDKNERKELLKFYTRNLPYRDLKEDIWDDIALKIEGATGDVIKKIGEVMWRDKLRWFILNNKKEAKGLVELLNKEDRFDINELDEKKAFNFKQRLGSFVYIDSKYLYSTVDAVLNDIAIRAEIDEAVETYKAAKRFVSQIGERKSSLILTS